VAIKKKILQCLTIARERMQNLQKSKVNNLAGNMSASLAEEMGLLTICRLQSLSIKIDFLHILREIC
jgi:hypothetical protein